MKKQYMRTVPNVMQSKVNYFFIFSPLSFCWDYISTGDFICQYADYGIAFQINFTGMKEELCQKISVARRKFL